MQHMERCDVPPTTELVMYDLRPLIQMAMQDFADSMPNVEDIVCWISRESVLTFLTPLPVTQDILAAVHRGKVIVPDRSKRFPEIVGLDPVTGGVIVAGLVALLQFASSERRHKEMLEKMSPPPPSPPKDPTPPPKDLCKKSDPDGRICGPSL